MCEVQDFGKFELSPMNMFLSSVTSILVSRKYDLAIIAGVTNDSNYQLKEIKHSF